ncbi:MAG: trypsin-like peptidase domain-containing protein, partial [Thermomicrobiales bacterium]
DPEGTHHPMTATLEAPPFTSANAAFSAAISDIVAAVTPSLVHVADAEGASHGAGVIWREDGLIVTNRHVLRGERAEITLQDGRTLPGMVTARHPERDLALVKIEASGLPAARAGDSSTVRPGELAIAIGHPPGQRSAPTVGVIVASGQATTPEGPRTGDWLQADVTLRPGNSGGPLVNARGEVIGINTMVSGRLSLAIPSATVAHFVAGERPGAARVWLGVNGLVVPLGRPDAPAGFLLSEVVEGSPAGRAGLILGDIVTGIAGRPITDTESVPAAILRLAPGEAVTLDVLRGGAPRQFTLVPALRA